MATNESLASKPPANTEPTNTQAQRPNAEILRTDAAASAGIARVRRLGVDPEKIGEAERRKLIDRGIHPDTFERVSVTWDGLVEEFGRPVGPQLYNDIAVIGFGGVRANRPRLSIQSLGDDKPVQGLDAERLAKRTKRRERVMSLLADAEAQKAKEA